MPDQFDIRPMVQKHSAISIERLRVVSRFEGVQLSEISRGIIFIFAAWSGPSVSAFARFTKILSAVRTDSLDLIVLDIDCLTAESAMKLFGDATFRLRRGGEVVWVRAGSVVLRSVSFSEDERLLYEYTKTLLSDEQISKD